MKSVIAFEFRKLFIKQKKYLFVLVFIVIELFFLFNPAYDINTEMEKYKDLYNEYMVTLSGKLNDEKASFVRGEYDSIEQSERERDRAYNDFEAGRITYDEFERIIYELDERVLKRPVVNLLYVRLSYVSASPENRYFLYDNGWVALFGSRRLNFALLLLILIIAAPIFCGEFESDMDKLLLSNKNGRSRSVAVKILLVVAFVILISLFGIIADFIFVLKKYGLPDGGYPLQSLEMFSNSEWNISLKSAYMYMSLMRIAGWVYFAVVTMFFSVATKKMVPTMFFGGLTVIVPYFALSGNIRYLIPLPLGFILGRGFFSGDEYKYLYGDKILVFKGIAKSMFFAVCAVSLVLLILSILMIFKIFTNKKFKGFKTKKLAAVLLLLPLILSGCGKASYKPVNCNLKALCQTANYNVFISGSKYFYIQNKGTGETQDVIRDAFITTSTHNVKSIYADSSSDKLYYLEADSYSRANIVIKELDLSTFKEKVIYDTYSRGDGFMEGYLSRVYHALKKSKSTYGRLLFVNEQSIFMWMDGSIYKVDRVLRTTEIIITDVNDPIAYDGANIYYKDSTHQIVKYNIETFEQSAYEGIKTYEFYYYDGFLYFGNLLDGGKLYRIATDGGEKQKVSDLKLDAYVCDGTDIYYLDRTKKSLNKISLADFSHEKLVDVEATALYNLEGYDRLYIKYSGLGGTKEYYFDKVERKLIEKELYK